MSLVVRAFQPNDKSLWDNYVNQHPAASAYHLSAWCQAVESAYGHKNASLIAVDGDKVVGILPRILMTRPFAPAQYCSLPFCDLGSALCDNQTIQQTLLTTAQNDLQQGHWDYRAQGEKLDDTDGLSDEQRATSKVSMLLSLPESADLLLNGFKSKLRSQIRKAEKNGLTTVIGRDTKLVRDFYQVFAINMRKLGSPVHSLRWFEAVIACYQQHACICVVYSDTTPIGAGLVLHAGKKISIPWASTLAEYNRLAPNMLLYWTLLAYACDQGMQLFDFGRSTPGEGTFKFKQQWGAEAWLLDWQSFNKHGKIPQAKGVSTGKVRVLVENIWSKLPMSVTTALGPKIRKHISL